MLGYLANNRNRSQREHPRFSRGMCLDAMCRVKETNDTTDTRTDNPGGRADRNHCGAATPEELAGRGAAWASGGFCSPPDGDWIDRMLSSGARTRY